MLLIQQDGQVFPHKIMGLFRVQDIFGWRMSRPFSAIELGYIGTGAGGFEGCFSEISDCAHLGLVWMKTEF